MRFLYLGAITLTSLCSAQGPEAPAFLQHGPLRNDQPRYLDLRTQSPNRLALVFRTAVGGAHVPMSPLWPSLAVPVFANPVLKPTDAQGRLQLHLPAPQWSGSRSGQSWFQALVPLSNGHWSASKAVCVRWQAQAPQGNWVQELSPAPLPQASSAIGAHALLTVDVDRDADLDLFVLHSSGVELWIDHGALGFLAANPSHWSFAPRPATCIAAADVDSDGDMDVVLGGAIHQGNAFPDVLMLNDGLGTFTISTALPPGDSLTSRVEFGDIDSDGDPDLVVARGQEGHGSLASPNQLYRNQAGTLVPDPSFAAASWNDGLAPTTAARFADADNDGDLDLLLARSDMAGLHGVPGELNILLFNDGSGSFAEPSSPVWSTLFLDNTLDAQWLDLDLDGDLDIVCANNHASIEPGASGDLWINQGGVQGGPVGAFHEAPGSWLESADPFSRVRLAVRVLDADTDGDPDLLLLVHDLFPSSRQVLLLNQGGAQAGTPGVFLRDSAFDPGQLICADAVCFDRNHDGEPELLIASSGTLSGDPSQARRILWLELTLP